MTSRDPAWDALWDEAKRADMVAVAERLGAKLKRSGADWVGPCPNGCARTDGFIVTPSKHLFLCRPSGVTGDAVDMVIHVKECGKPEALEFVTGHRLPSSPPNDPPRPKDAAARKKERADEEAIEAVLKRAKPIKGTHAEAYLRARGIDPQRKLTKDLLFADVDYWNERERLATLPAMVAPIRDVAGKVIGIHQTYLDPKEPRKWTPPDGLSAKKIRGRAKGGLIRLGSIGDKLAVGEGIETTLRWYGRGLGPEDISIACGVSLNNIAGSCTGTLPHPTAKVNGKPARYPNGEPDVDKPGMVLPEDVRELILLGDGDSEPLATRAKIATAVRRHLNDGLVVSVHFAPNDKDWANEIGDEVAAIEGGEAFLERIAPPRHNRPTIELSIAETERIVDEIEAALIASDRGLYRRGGLIVSTGFDKMQTWDGRTIEVQIIEERDNYALLEDIEAIATFEKYNTRTKKWTRTPPSLSMALTLKQRTNRLRLPNLVSVVNCPTIKANGELIAEPGFYDDVGILFDPRGVKFPPVPQRPDKAMAMTAMARIMRLIGTFDFVSPDDKAVALSLILTAIARPCLPTAPLHGFDAPVAGAGKSKLVDLASVLATGHEAGVVAQGETREEAEKRFSTLLMRGDLIIALDNCEGPLEGVVFNQALTQQWANLRILGQSKAIRVRCAALITATGNNLVIKGDLTRRSVVCRLDPKVERPELRQFTYDPIADAKDNRGELVAAALTILRANQVAGRPAKPPRLQSFEVWSDTVRGALVWLGAGDPVATMDRLRKADPVLASLTAVLHAWRVAFDSQPTTVREAIEEATNGTGLCGELACGKADECLRPHACQRTPNADLREALMAVAGRGGKIDSRALGNWLAQKAADRIVNIANDIRPEPVAMEVCGERSGVAVWRLTARG